MTKVAIIYFSGYGHTVKQAEAVEKGAASVSGVTVTTIKIPADGTIEDSQAICNPRLAGQGRGRLHDFRLSQW